MAGAIEKFFQDPKLADSLRAQSRNSVLARWKKADGVERLEQALLATVADVHTKKT